MFRDSITFFTKYLPGINITSIAGYHMREAGATREQDIGFTMAFVQAYIQEGIDAGLDVDEFVPKFSFNAFGGSMELLKEVAFKPVETLFYFTEEEFKEPALQSRNILIFARSCDINAFKRLDDIFINNGPVKDIYYQQQREKVKFILMECGEGFDSCFCVTTGTNATDDYALIVRPDEGFVECQVKDPELKPYFNELNENIEITPRFVNKNQHTPQISQNISSDVFKNPLWQEYTSRCTGCGKCNFVCPTCSCFTMQDISYRDNQNCGERRRVWASCKARAKWFSIT